MSKLLFDWKDEDPVALIVTITALALLLLLPWASCDVTGPLQGRAETHAQAAVDGHAP